MAALKTKTRKRFAKQVRKLVKKYGSEAVTNVVAGVIATPATQAADLAPQRVKQSKKGNAMTLHTHTPAA